MGTTAYTTKDIQELRQRTGAGMMDCKAALEEASGDKEKAIEILRKKGVARTEKRAGREVKEGLVQSYIHHNAKLGVLVEVNCETDFVARNEDFRNLVKAIAEHIAAGVPAPAVAVTREQVPADLVERERRIFTEQAVESGKPQNIVDKMVQGRVDKYYKEVVLLDQPWVRDDSKTIGDLVKEVSAKTGENIVVRRFARFAIGQD